MAETPAAPSVSESAVRIRQLGDRLVSALGLGCWAIGGVLHDGATALGWGHVDDDESMRAIEVAVELGIRLFDTADVYGAGHSERLLGSVLGDRYPAVMIATKFGLTFDEKARTLTGADVSRDYIRRACEGSLTRLRRESIDLYQLHVGDLSRDDAESVADTLEELAAEGLIRGYGWSTDDVSRAAQWQGRPHYVAVQHNCNALEDSPSILHLCEEAGLASINRGPLAMGLLSGTMGAQTRFGALDVRAANVEWLPYFVDGRPRQEWLDRVSTVRDILTSDGRTPAQGAISWLWARSSLSIPIPGFRTVEQVRENAAALNLPSLSEQQLVSIRELSSPKRIGRHDQGTGSH